MKLYSQVSRELFRKRFTWGLVATAAIVLLILKTGIIHLLPTFEFFQGKWVNLVLLTFVIWILILVCRTLTNICNLRRNELGITWCQISILVLIGLWIAGVAIILDIKENETSKVFIGGFGALFAWIFQDTIKGVVSFIHLRMNNLLRIGDWIEVPEHNVDGEVKSVTLTQVTLYNWDTTTSSIPTSMLHSEHFINRQNMMVGKTYGRRMYMTFILDTGWFHCFSKEEKRNLENTGDILKYLPCEEIEKSSSNAQLFRLYTYHWLMNNPHISQLPRLIVRWMEQKEQGMPLQVYAFITDSSLPSFEWQQSQIVEHIIESLDWFGLRLYQSPSAYDVSNSNVFLTDKPANYRKED